MDGEIVSCEYLTNPSTHHIHLNPKFYCTEYPLTKCCKTCTVLKRHNYRILNGFYTQTTDIPTTTADLFYSGKSEVNVTQKKNALKTFFTVPISQEQMQTTMSLTRRTTNKILLRTDSVTEHSQIGVSMSKSTPKPDTLQHNARTVLYRPNHEHTVQQFFTLPPEVRLSGKTLPALVTVKYSDTGTAEVNVPVAEPTQPTEILKTVFVTQKTREPRADSSPERTIKAEAVTTSSALKLVTAASTTVTPLITTSVITTDVTRPKSTTTKTTATTSSTTSTPSTTYKTSKPRAKTTLQKEVSKRTCKDIGIWVVSGSVPCEYLERDNKYGLNKNQLYFCNRYPLTSCCETCERIRRTARK